jgi:CheY-like chemotaxis protein
MSVTVLLIEDNPGDIRLTREAFRESGFDVDLHVAEDGVDAMRFLRREGVDANAPRPDFVLLDLNLPRKDGREVLALIKDDPNLKTIPTVVLTTSDAEADIVKSYQLHANCYISKPLEFQKFSEVVGQIYELWMQTATLLRKCYPT